MQHIRNLVNEHNRCDVSELAGHGRRQADKIVLANRGNLDGEGKLVIEDVRVHIV